ncbi:hypothetical protein XvhCFBP2543_04170 [Xanthomonas vasicola]|uniref:Transposase n=1 Tax=Xanthomonas vasicola TaxID=56459 RepID=A0ABD7S606_XANVA|nr:hypothetical protein XvhCFBP2543_04170 [Xanthomonas vasicola]TWQ29363.1 hypothetical protein FQJ97_18715 [Xanthomonas vasicola]TWQ35148.1 hypothetical protein FQJ96_18110 [Xanthomonas vasicola]TWQ50248.1 hypothetical protein FQK01_18960 [Xanthomonas vasicola]TWQ52093.1 hypothetical protein FQJ94_16960 [Xanthomonas vasicola]
MGWWFWGARNRADQLADCFVETLRTDQPDWSLPAHRRGTLGGTDAATELTMTYLKRVPRWWAGKGSATKPQLVRSPTQLC